MFRNCKNIVARITILFIKQEKQFRLNSEKKGPPKLLNNYYYNINCKYIVEMGE